MRPSLPVCLALLALGLAACDDEKDDTGTPSPDDTSVDDTGNPDTEPPLLDEDHDGYTADVDCDDNDYTAHPGGTEECDGADDDCDGAADEDFDLDVDGQATCAGDCDDEDATIYAGATEVPYDGIDQDCDGADVEDADDDGFRAVEVGGNDCDDTNPDVNLAQTEIPKNGLDDDCRDGDDIDGDGDGYGDVDWGGDDCDDADPGINPAADDIPFDGIDQDCSGADSLDEDHDHDGYDSTAMGGDDCDDFDPDVHPGAEEVCDGADNDCDGETDPDSSSGAPTWYYDADGDGFGDEEVSTVACEAPDGYVGNDEDCDDTDPEILECACTLTAVSEPTTLVRSGSTYGQWMADPEETLGAGLHWEMDAYGDPPTYTLTEYASLDDLVARSSSGTVRLPYAYDGTGAVVYDGYLYYNQSDSDTLVKFDLATEEVDATLTLTGAGYHNTYPYQWGGYSDIDFAVDENGLWVLYATAANSGRMVISSIDVDSFSLVETWNTSSDRKGDIGNAFMVCGVMYAIDDYSSSSTTISYTYDTEESTGSSASIRWYNDYGYNSMVAYNPADETIYSWDNSVRVTYTPTIE